MGLKQINIQNVKLFLDDSVNQRDQQKNKKNCLK